MNRPRSTTSRSSSRKPRPRIARRWWWAGGVVAIGIVAVVVSVVRAGYDDSVPDPPVPSSSDGAPVTFAPDGAHADLPPEPGCDQLFFHARMAMFNPELADQLLDNDCPYPFDPDAISMEGGEEDPSLAAPYEPRRYLELFDVLTAERIGLCSVTRLAEESVRGFVYGFGVTAHADSCAASNANLEIAIREYAERAHRDAAANAAKEQIVQVLGRFTVAIDGDDAAVVERLAAAFESIGAERVP